MATAINPITGNLIKSKGTYTQSYQDGYDRIFGDKKKKAAEALAAEQEAAKESKKDENVPT